MTLTEQYAHYVADMTWAEVEDEPQRHARWSLLDWMGVTVSGLYEPSARLLTNVLGAGGAPLRDAGTMALLLGHAGYTAEFEQTHVPSSCHISAVSWPALLDWLWTAERPAGPTDPREWLVAFVAGFEVAAHIGRVLGPFTFERNWHNTALFGTIGAAAMVARCAGGDARHIAMAMATASNLASGTQAGFGTDTIAFGVANAAHLGRLSGGLVGANFNGPSGVFEPRGSALANMLLPRTLDLPPFSPGPPGEMRWNAFKPYPTALLTHSAVECALVLRNEIPAAQLSEVEITLSTDASQRVDRPLSENVATARYSVQYCVKQAWLAGAVGTAVFNQAALSSAETAAFAPMTIRADPALPLYGARLKATTLSQQTLVHEVIVPLGFAERPLSEAALHAKFMMGTELHLGNGPANHIAELVLDGDPKQLREAVDLFRSIVSRVVTPSAVR